MNRVNIIGAGLAGCECAYILSKNNIKVNLYEMKKTKKSPAHISDNFAELVCSNSLKSDALTNACGLLKEEMRQLSGWIASLDRSIPLHISRFFPCFHMTDKDPTDVEHIYKLAEIAREQLEFVYTGNC